MGQAGVRTLAVALALGPLFGPTPALAEMYRWVDENGVTVYSQQPPSGRMATTIKPDAPPSAAEVQRATERIRGLVEQDADRAEDKARAAEEAGKKSAEQAKSQSNCDALRQNLATLRTHGRGRLRTPDGKTIVLSGAELEQRIAETEEQIRKDCK
jgi:hypothetical protein